MYLVVIPFRVMAYFLGIDGGGTRTTAVLGDEHSVLAEATAGGSSITRLGEERTREALHKAVLDVCSMAGLQPSQLDRVVAGVAGASREQVSTALKRILSDVTPAEIRIVGDMVIAHHAALGGDPGVIVLSGTGSIAYGRNERDETARAGGWGFAISDEGSGHWIGRAALKAGLRSYDAGENSTLFRAILRHWQLSSVDDLVRLANSTPSPDFSLLFPHVLELANAGDKHARALLIQAGEELAKLAVIVLRRLFSEKSPVRVATAGGVFRSAQIVHDVVSSEIHADWPSARVEQSPAVPAMGALILARNGPGLK